MSKKWFIADTHHHHKNILEFEDRPFDTLEEMTEKMIDAWNAVVGKNDTVYLVGDFSFGKVQEWTKLLDSLKGDIVLIKGNHDKSKIIERVLREGYLKELHMVGELLKVDKYYLNLSHYPMEIGARPFIFSVHGHIHNQPSNYLNQINVGVDSGFMHKYYRTENVPFGTPVHLEYIMGQLEKINTFLMEEKSNG